MRALVGLVIAVAACGDDAVLPDAPAADAAPDAELDGPPPPAGCAYGEYRDTTNAAAPENTHIIFDTTLAAPMTWCGQLDTGHYEPTSQLVDADGFAFTVDASGARLLVTLAGAGAETLDDVELSVRRLDDPIAVGTFVGDHAALHIVLAPGTRGADATWGAACTTQSRWGRSVVLRNFDSAGVSSMECLG